MSGKKFLTKPSRNVLEWLHYDTGFSKAQMARELGIPEKSYYQYCRMRIEPRWDLLSWVVEVLRRHGCRVKLDKYAVPPQADVTKVDLCSDIVPTTASRSRVEI